ncbi:hypothetical protein TSOC_013916 [Tetrabaena socialis]|uniref:C-CAP/cofactor C-like domain-containing protein n=1 Tax=Tetrabaena socialis TaxID=47790 RepID=A0A2J7ZJ31_9CHLO|nr:hypothetical protein TSOC_013916 [Tetrabaena socialis]|eukprot:PNH00266.1 hypothetical protein TSOC_013916 [Tetrabaena socialis]
MHRREAGRQQAGGGGGYPAAGHAKQGHQHWPAARRRCRTPEAQQQARLQQGDLADDDDLLLPAALGEYDAALPPRIHMLLQRAPSSEGGTSTSTCSTRSGISASLAAGAGAAGAGQRVVAVSARHLAHGAATTGRLLVAHALLPAARLSGHASRAALATTATVAVVAGCALARATRSFFRFATAPRRSICGYDGAPAAAVGGEDGRHTRGRFRGGAAAVVDGGAPAPFSNLVGARIKLSGCRNTRLRIEYCRDCVVVASGLEGVELLLVGCQRVKLVLLRCRGLLLRELQCSDMGDFVRRGCDGFAHEIVCLRCACKPSSSGGGAAH